MTNDKFMLIIDWGTIIFNIERDHAIKTAARHNAVNKV